MDRLSRLLDTAMIVWLFPGAARCRLTSGGGGDGIQGLNLSKIFVFPSLATICLLILFLFSLFLYFCPEHVEDDVAAFGDQGEQGDAATGVQLPEADGVQGASINGGGASGIIFWTTNST
jgi:hypothetical protein